MTFQVAGNTGSPADRDYVNEAVDYFKNKLRFANVIIPPPKNPKPIIIIILGNTGPEQRCRSKAYLATGRRLHQRSDWF